MANEKFELDQLRSFQALSTVQESQLKALLVLALLTDTRLADKIGNTPAVIAAIKGTIPALSFPDEFLNDTGKGTNLIKMLGSAPVADEIKKVANFMSSNNGAYPDPSSHARLMNSMLKLITH